MKRASHMRSPLQNNEYILSAQHVAVFRYYCSLKFTGNVISTRTGLPDCLAGVHFGMISTRRTASLSRYISPIDLITSIFWIEMSV